MRAVHPEILRVYNAAGGREAASCSESGVASSEKRPLTHSERTQWFREQREYIRDEIEVPRQSDHEVKTTCIHTPPRRQDTEDDLSPRNPAPCLPLHGLSLSLNTNIPTLHAPGRLQAFLQQTVLTMTTKLSKHIDPTKLGAFAGAAAGQ